MEANSPTTDGRQIAYSYTRRMVSELDTIRQREPLLALHIFLYRLLSSALERLKFDWPNALAISSIARSLSEEIFDEREYLHCVALATRLSEAPPEVLRDPALIGWCYQTWNERLRDENSWAISLRTARQSESVQVGVVTQLFTDDYIADFLFERCRLLLRGHAQPAPQPPSVCDPACGVGHLLLAAIRAMSTPKGAPLWLVGNLWGFDIDPCAVRLARALVFLQMMICGYSGDPTALWASLQRTILALEAPHGTLSRARGNNDIPEQFDIVVTNPPYLGRRKLPVAMREFLDSEYPSARVDLCAAFMQRCIELTAPGGALGLLTSDKWLRLGGYAPLRVGDGAFKGILGELSIDLVCELGERSFHPTTTLHDGVKPVLLCGRKQVPQPGHNVSLCSIAKVVPYHQKVMALRDLAHEGLDSGRHARIEQRTWSTRGTASVMLQANALPSALISSGTTVARYADVVVGIQTNDDQRYVRYVWQVPGGDPSWRLHAKGGGYARWGGLNRWVIDWESGKNDFFKTTGARAKAETWAAREGWCYTWFANGSLGLRPKAPGATFGRAAASGVFCSDDRIVAFLNSRVASMASRSTSGKIQLPEGIVRTLPAPRNLDAIMPLLISAVTTIKSELMKGDVADALFDPQHVRLRVDTFVLEALILALEAELESQVERALGMTSYDTLSLCEKAGPVVGWFPTHGDISGHAIWDYVPVRYKNLKEFVIPSASTMPHGAELPGTSLPDISEIVRRKGKSYSRCYALPSTGIIEHLSRVCERHPFDVAMECIRLMDRDDEVCKSLCLPSLCDAVAAEVLQALGHSGWSVGGAGHATKGSLELDTEGVCAIVERQARRLGFERLVTPSTTEWVRMVFIPWQEKKFLKASPISIEFSDTREMRLTHRRWWEERFESARISAAM